jgi:nucleoside-diphosphate-sugar epimerase
MEKVLVTGGGGYIGSVLVGDLLSRGYEVTVIDNFFYEENSLALHYANPKLNVINADVRNTSLLKTSLQIFDWIIPLAAIVGAPACNRDEIAAKTINVDSALELFALAPSHSKIIMPTTNSAYGTTKPGTITTEDSALNPISTYARHKVEVEQALMSRGNASSLRLATVFGMSPRMRLDLLVNDLVNRALKDKSVVLFEASFIRNFIHVRDVARAICHAMENWGSFEGEIFNVGLTSANISKKELCIKIQKKIPDFVFTEAELSKDPDQRNYWVSNEKLEMTGFMCNFDLDFGISELIKGLPNIRNSRYGNV